MTPDPRNCPICGREPDEEYTPGCPSCEMVRQFIEGTGDPNKRPIGFLNATVSGSDLVPVREPGDCPLCGCLTIANAAGNQCCPECAAEGGAEMPSVIGRRMRRGLGIPRDVH